MTDAISVLLTSFAVYSNFYAIVTIVLSFMATAIFILRLNNGLPFHTRREEDIPNTAIERPIVSQSNPFCIELCEASQSSLKDGLLVHLSSLCHGNLIVFWGPEIEPVFSSMAQATDIFLTDLEQGKHLQDKCLYTEFVKRLECDTDEDIYIACPTEVEESHLGGAPRKRYSCILIAAVPSNSIFYSSDIIASLAIIHLKDSLVRMGSQIMNQFVKTGDGRVYSLKSLYLTINEENSAQDSLPSTAKSRTDDTVKPNIVGLESNSSAEKQNGYSSSNSVREESTEITNTNYCPSGCDNVIGSSADCPVIETNSLLSNSGERQDINLTNSSRFEELRVLNSSDSDTDVAYSSSVEQLTNMLSNPRENQDINFTSSSSFEELHVLNIRESDPDVVNSSSVEELSEELSEVFDHPLEAANAFDYPECVVCQSRPQSHVLLPCRHACVCHDCFKQLTRCPMCRATIESFFRLFNSVDDEVEIREPPAPTDFISWVVHLNRKLNECLGFT